MNSRDINIHSMAMFFPCEIFQNTNVWAKMTSRRSMLGEVGKCLKPGTWREPTDYFGLFLKCLGPSYFLSLLTNIGIEWKKSSYAEQRSCIQARTTASDSPHQQTIHHSTSESLGRQWKKYRKIRSLFSGCKPRQDNQGKGDNVSFSMDGTIKI